MNRYAHISGDRRFRYTLGRSWGEAARFVIGMLNPSVADGERDDPTVLRLIKWGQLWGCGSFVAVNAVPFVSSDPAEALAWIRRGADAFVPDVLRINAKWVEASCIGAAFGIVAWGNLPDELQPAAHQLMQAFRRALGSRIYCFGRTKHGHPIHPMARGRHRVSDDVALVRFEERA